MKGDMQMSNCNHSGQYYWCVKTDLSEDGEIYVHADEVEITPNGALVFLRVYGDSDSQNLGIARGHWKSFHAADVMDGGAVAVEYWKGEVVR